MKRIISLILIAVMLISATTNAKVSVENFENANLPTSPVNTGTYSNVTFATTCGSTFQLGTDKFSDGSKSLQVNVSNQANFKYFLNLTDYKNNITENICMSKVLSEIYISHHPPIPLRLQSRGMGGWVEGTAPPLPSLDGLRPMAYTSPCLEGTVRWQDAIS